MGRIFFFLLLALAAYIGWRWLRSRSSASSATSASRSPADAAAESMVRCESCGLNLPQSEALPGADASASRWYCSESHRREARPE